MKLVEKIEKEVCTKKNGVDVVLEKEKESIVSIICKFIETVSDYSERIDEDILIKKIAALDLIRFEYDKDVDFLLDGIESSSNFHREIDSDSYNGIVLFKDFDEEGIHTFFHLLMHQIIENEVRENEVYHREFIDLKLDNKLKEGFIESFSEVIWNKAFPSIDCPGMEDDKYFAESQIMGIMSDIMGAKRTFDTLVAEPEQLIDALESTEYKGESLGDYLEGQLNSVNIVNKKRISLNSRIINCVEAISDCSSDLVIEGVKYKVKE